MRTSFLPLSRPLPLLLLLACGDATSATGELGRIDFQLHTDYETDEVSLTDALLVAGHPLHIDTTLTDQGVDDAGDQAGAIRFKADSPDVIVEMDGPEDELPDLTLTATGDVDTTIEATLDGEVFDYLGFHFRAPDALEKLVWTRGPLDEDMVEASGATIAAEEGGSAAFLVVPKVDGDRLYGDVQVTVTTVPEGIAVPDFDAISIYEQEVYGGIEPMMLVFIEPGSVEVTLTDEANGIAISQRFEVSAFGG